VPLAGVEAAAPRRFVICNFVLIGVVVLFVLAQIPVKFSTEIYQKQLLSKTTNFSD
jgi:hypothetical protein